jgi:hypothetical protein
MPPIPDEIRDETRLADIPSQAAFFEIIGEFFAEVSEHRPLLLVLEDLHWADQSTLDLLRFIARFLSGLPILVLATYRDDELTRHNPLYELLPLLVREGGASQLTLHRLEAADTRALVRERYQLTDRDADRLIEYLQQSSEGNPFFTSELLGALEDEETLQETEDGWQLGALVEGSVPPLLRQVIEGRLQRLEQSTRELLEIAAVIGHEVPIDLWQQTSGRAAGELSEAMVTAIDTNLLNESKDGISLIFNHALDHIYKLVMVGETGDTERSVSHGLLTRSSSTRCYRYQSGHVYPPGCLGVSGLHCHHRTVATPGAGNR